MICQCRFISCNKCTTLVEDVNKWRRVCKSRSNIWEISVPSSQFFCEPKIALIKIALKKKKKSCQEPPGREEAGPASSICQPATQPHLKAKTGLVCFPWGHFSTPLSFCVLSSGFVRKQKQFCKMKTKKTQKTKPLPPLSFLLLSFPATPSPLVFSTYTARVWLHTG